MLRTTLARVAAPTKTRLRWRWYTCRKSTSGPSIDAAGASRNKDIHNLAINFGVPGDRIDEAGTLWLEYPAVAGESPPFTIELNSDATFFQHHSSILVDAQRPWLGASGIENVTDLRIGLRLESQFNLTETGLPVEDPQDDGEESEVGDVSLDSSDLELVRDDNNQTVGLRFNNVPLAQVRQDSGSLYPVHL